MKNGERKYTKWCKKEEECDNKQVMVKGWNFNGKANMESGKPDRPTQKILTPRMAGFLIQNNIDSDLNDCFHNACNKSR